MKTLKELTLILVLGTVALIAIGTFVNMIEQANEYERHQK